MSERKRVQQPTKGGPPLMELQRAVALLALERVVSPFEVFDARCGLLR